MKKYKKKSVAELVKISKALTYEHITIENMKRLRLTRANKKLKKRDEEITLLTNKVKEAVQAKSDLESEVGSLKAEFYELEFNMTVEKQGRVDKVALLTAEINQLKELLEKAWDDSKANFDRGDN